MVIFEWPLECQQRHRFGKMALKCWERHPTVRRETQVEESDKNRLKMPEITQETEPEITQKTGSWERRKGAENIGARCRK